MELAVIRFAGHDLPHNPKTLKVERSKSVGSVSLLGGKNIMNSVTEKASKISGTGELYGENCFKQYNELSKIHFLNKSAVLAVPNVGVFNAVLSDLKLLAEPKNNVISISFEFTCINGEEASKISPTEFHTVLKDESLWDISYRYNIPIENLIELNPWLRNLWNIEIGKEVRLV